MPDAALRSLLRLELRRARGHVRKTAWGTLLVVGGMYLLFGRGREGLAMALALLGMTQGLVPLARTLTDKLDGSLEFLTSLPVEPRTLARAHLLACAGWACVAAIPWTVSVGLGAVEAFGVALGVGHITGIFVLLAALTAAVSALASAVVMRFAVETLGWLPLAVLLGAAGLGMLVDRQWPHAASAVLAWLSTPQAPFVVFAAGITVAALGLAGAAHLLARGYQRFRPTNVPLPPSLKPFPS